jgi:hypothetical protein
MSFNATIDLGVVGRSITGETVSISGCTGINSSSECTGCTVVSASEVVNTFPKLITGFQDNHRYVHIEVISGDCIGESQCLAISNIPTPTPTPTPSPTPTAVPVTATPTPTPTAVPVTATPTPTPTPTPSPSPTPTAVPADKYEFVVCYDPYETALQSVVFTYAEIIGAGFTGVPLYSDKITVSGSPNVDAVYQYNGTTSSATTIPVITSINELDCSGNAITPTPTPTPLPPVAEFSVSYGSNSSTAPGSTGSTYNPTITVTNSTALIKLSVTVQTGYQGDTTLTIPGVGSYSPTAAQGNGNTTFIEFNLGVGTYNCTWVVQAISDGTTTVATSTITQVF